MNQLSLESINRLNPEDRVIIYFSVLTILTDSFKNILKKVDGDDRSSDSIDDLATSSVLVSLERFVELTDEEKSQMLNLATEMLSAVVIISSGTKTRGWIPRSSVAREIQR